MKKTRVMTVLVVLVLVVPASAAYYHCTGGAFPNTHRSAAANNTRVVTAPGGWGSRVITVITFGNLHIRANGGTLAGNWVWAANLQSNDLQGLWSVRGGTATYGGSWTCGTLFIDGNDIKITGLVPEPALSGAPDRCEFRAPPCARCSLTT